MLHAMDRSKLVLATTTSQLLYLNHSYKPSIRQFLWSHSQHFSLIIVTFMEPQDIISFISEDSHCLPAPANASRSSPLESERAMTVVAATVYRPWRLEGRDRTFTSTCTTANTELSAAMSPSPRLAPDSLLQGLISFTPQPWWLSPVLN